MQNEVIRICDLNVQPLIHAPWPWTFTEMWPGEYSATGAVEAAEVVEAADVVVVVRSVPAAADAQSETLRRGLAEGSPRALRDVSRLHRGIAHSRRGSQVES